MPKKPTYTELEKKIRSLEAQINQEQMLDKTAGKKEMLQASILSKTPLFMMIVGAQGNVEMVSNALLEFTGQTPETYVGLRGGAFLKCIHHLDDPKGCGFGDLCKTCKIRQTVQHTIDTGTPHYKVEAELVSMDNPMEKRNLLLSTALINLPEKKVLAFIEDITEQKIIGTLLKDQTDFLNALIETITSPIFYKDLHGHYKGCNKAFEDFIAKPRSDIIGKTVYDMGPKELADQYHKMDQWLFKNPGKQSYEWKVKTSDGVYKEVIFDKATLHDEFGNVTGLVGVISDITDRKHSETLVHNLSQMLIQAQERERQMISCELHDSIAQNLSTVKLYCNQIFGDPACLNKNTKACLSNMLALIDQTVTEVRDLAYDLRPPSLDHLGLVHALEVFCEAFSEKNNIAVDFQAAGIKGLTQISDMEINLYRLVQEGLNNIRKHAAATKAIIRLVGAYPHIILRIEDNGRGFNVKEKERLMINEKRMGLWSMKERVNLLQGEMTIHSQPGRGTQITIKLVLQDN
ncbi:MAG: PAS domain S-box protein [Pseudomonadota bacterium]